MAMYVVEGDALTSIADAVRSKTGSNNNMTLCSMSTIIKNYSAEDTSAEIVDGSVEEYTNDAVITIGENAFIGCTSLTYANFPVCTSIGNDAFKGCASLTSVSFPACVSVGARVFSGCTSLTSANFPVCTSINNNMFYSCTSLKSVNFPACISISGYAFYNCKSLMNLTLAGSSVATLGLSGAFNGTPMSSSALTGSFGSIYVPASLVASYRAATNWTYYSARITSII